MQKKRDLTKYQQCTFVWDKEWWASFRKRAEDEHMTAAAFVKRIIDDYEKKETAKDYGKMYEQTLDEMKKVNEQMRQMDVKVNSIMAMLSTTLNKLLVEESKEKTATTC